MRAVVDTNVILSAVLGGALSPLLDHWRAGHFTLVVTTEIAHEYLTVLRRPKFSLSAEVVEAIGAYMFRKAEFVTPTERLLVIKVDPKDDMFLDAAVAGEVDLIVSGDRHLLELGHYRHYPIITAREFLNQLEAMPGEA